MCCLDDNLERAIDKIDDFYRGDILVGSEVSNIFRVIQIEQETIDDRESVILFRYLVLVTVESKKKD